ncbi:MAG: GntR family transcriptional regulator [Alphaproteobacteria bacterium]|nr:GntR family transcriptional regulator [Alphaproteobacteria bacterium]
MNERLETPQLHAQIYARLRDALIFGRLEAGQQVSVRTVADQFGISVTPARDAMRQLIWEGGLEVRANGRIYVPLLDRAGVESLRDESRTIELLLLARALPRLGAAGAMEVERLAARADAAFGAGDIREGLECLRAARQAFFDASDCPWLLEIHRRILVRRGPQSIHFIGDYLRARRAPKVSWHLVAVRTRDLDQARRALIAESDAFFDFWADHLDRTSAMEGPAAGAAGNRIASGGDR